MRERFYDDVIALFRGIKGIFREESARFKISPSLLSTLHILRLNGPCTMGELSEQLELSHGAVTAIVDRLGGLGLVEREHSEKDRRVVNVCLSAAARVSQQEVLVNTRRKMKEIIDLLDPDEQQEVDRGIGLLSKAFKVYEGNMRERSAQIER